MPTRANHNRAGDDMLTMTDESRVFLEKNCPAVLAANNLSEALDILEEDIEKKGFGGEHFDEYNDYGRAAQRVYDDLYFSNNLNEEIVTKGMKDQNEVTEYGRGLYALYDAILGQKG